MPWRIGSIILLILLYTFLPAQKRNVKVIAVTPKGESIELYKDSYALVAGVSDYTNGWPDLPNALKDAREVKAELEAQGFKVTLLPNPTGAQLEAALKTFVSTHGQDPQNRLFFFFAGHGHTEELSYGAKMGYIVPADAPLPSRDKAGFLQKALDMQTFENHARRIQAKHALFIFDSCFSGSIFAMARAPSEAISYKTARPVRQFITAGDENETVPDVSVFKNQLLAGLRGEADADRDGYVTGTELGNFLQDRVINYTRSAQHPQYGKIRDPQLDKGDFVFVAPSAASPAGPEGGAPGQTPGLDLRAYQQEAQLKQQWADWQQKMKKDYDAANSLDRDGNLSPASKAKMWSDFIAAYPQDNPYSEEDETLRRSALERKTAWQNYKPQSAITSSPRAGVEGMIFVTGGTFQMGDTFGEGEDDEKTVHSVTVNDFYMSKYEVSVADFRKFVNAAGYKTDAEKGGGAFVWEEGKWVQKADINWRNPSFSQSENHPVVCVSWYDAVEYCNWRSQQEGLTPCYRIDKTRKDPNNTSSYDDKKWLVSCDFSANGYRLPTEAEWEYAAREGGKKVRFGNGKDIADPAEINFAGSADYKKSYSVAGVYRQQTVAVGTFSPNRLELYDMSGNVLEWCWDWYGDYSSGSQKYPKGSASGYSRVLRGGSWNDDPNYARAADRYYDYPYSAINFTGFRLARTR